MTKRKEKSRIVAVTGHDLVKRLKDLHYKRTVRKDIQEAQKRLNRRMQDERYQEMVKGMSSGAQAAFWEDLQERRKQERL